MLLPWKSPPELLCGRIMEPSVFADAHRPTVVAVSMLMKRAHACARALNPPGDKNLGLFAVTMTKKTATSHVWIQPGTKHGLLRQEVTSSADGEPTETIRVSHRRTRDEVTDRTSAG